MRKEKTCDTCRYRWTSFFRDPCYHCIGHESWKRGKWFLNEYLIEEIKGWCFSILITGIIVGGSIMIAEVVK